MNTRRHIITMLALSALVLIASPGTAFAAGTPRPQFIQSMPAVMASPQGHGFSLAAPIPVNGRMTRFNPLQHGFQFRNDFVTELRVADVQNLRWGGLCGGMSYAALDYFYTGRPILRQDTLPATGSPLFNYIYNRQITSIVENVDKWAELVANPFGWRTSEFFNWGLQVGVK